MAKFIKIRNRLINIDKVYDFMLCGHAIYVFYSANEEDYASIEFNNDYEAALIFEDIPHLIDNNYIPSFVREQQLNELKFKTQRAEAKAAISAMDASNWDELPF